MLSIGSVDFVFGRLAGRIAVVHRKALSPSELQYERSFVPFIAFDKELSVPPVN